MLAVEGLITCRRDVVALHETLCKVLRTFKYGSGFRRTYYWHVLGALVGL